MDLILLEPGNPELVFGKTPDGGKAGIDAIWRDAAALQGMGQCIELVSLHQGMKQQVTTDVSNSARNSGRPMITDFTCVKYVDQTSVKLYELCLRAQPLGSGADIGRGTGNDGIGQFEFTALLPPQRLGVQHDRRTDPAPPTVGAPVDERGAPGHRLGQAAVGQRDDRRLLRRHVPLGHLEHRQARLAQP